MDDIIVGKLDVDTFLNPEFKATLTIARELLTKLCSPEKENTSDFNVLFDTCLVLFKSFTETLTSMSLILLDENRKDKHEPLNKNYFNNLD